MRTGTIGSLLICLFATLSQPAPLTYMKFYADTRLERLAVPNADVSWSKNIFYNPFSYSVPCDYREKCDDAAWSVYFGYNRNINGVDRRSATGLRYKRDSKYSPLNPKGRTGLQGRGVLPRFGPNHEVVVILTRNRDPLEYAIIPSASADPSLTSLDFYPSELTDQPEEFKLPTKLESFLRSELNKLYPNITVEDMIEHAKKTRKLLYKGYYHDQRNTDNAWVETWIYEIADNDCVGIGTMELSGENELGLVWRRISEQMFKNRVKTLISYSSLTPAEKFFYHVSKKVWGLKEQSVDNTLSGAVDLINHGLNVAAIGVGIGTSLI